MFTQEKFDAMPKFESLKYYFVRKSTGKVFEIYENGECIGEYNEIESRIFSNTGCMFDDVTVMEIVNAFNLFSRRPEYSIAISSEELNFMSTNQEALIDLYEKALVGVAFIRTYRNTKADPDKSWPKIARCLEWLRKLDFYSAPASTIYHGSFFSGLLLHSLQVVAEAQDLLKLPKFKYVKIDDATLVALVHDWCKIGRYKPYDKNIKNEATGTWEKTLAYKFVDSPYPFGHGETSMFLANKYFNLTLEESLAIRHHMGAWKCHESDHNDLQRSNETYPLVLLLQFADQLSITSY